VDIERNHFFEGKDNPFKLASKRKKKVVQGLTTSQKKQVTLSFFLSEPPTAVFLKPHLHFGARPTAGSKKPPI